MPQPSNHDRATGAAELRAAEPGDRGGLRRPQRHYSADELVALRQRGETRTRSDAPSIEPDEEFWSGAEVVMPSGKASIHLRVDSDVLAWFKSQGKGHLTRMNAVLRSYVEAHKHGSR